MIKPVCAELKLLKDYQSANLYIGCLKRFESAVF